MSTRLITTAEAAELVQRQPATIRGWVHRGRLTAVTHDARTGTALYRRRDVWLAEKAARLAHGGRPRRADATPRHADGARPT